MMSRTRRVVILLALFVALSVPMVAGAQAAITAEPVTVMAMRGAVETRTLLLRASGPVTSVQVVALDLANADGSNVLPAGAIRVDLPADTITAGGLLTVPVTFDLRNAPSGEFKGSLIVSVTGNTFSVPVALTVKDPPLAPFIVLLAGVALGWGMSWYRSRGKPRDGALVKLGRFRARLQAEAGLGQAFRYRVDGLIVDAEALVRGEKWDESTKTIDQAEAVLDKWRKGRDDWQAQLDYYGELSRKISGNGVDQDSHYIRSVKTALDQAIRSAPDLGGPEELRQRLDPLHQQINAYLTLKSLFGRLGENLEPLLHTANGQVLQQKVTALRARFDALTPTDQAGYDSLRSDAEALVADLGQRVRGLNQESLATAKGLGFLSGSVAELLDPPPAARALSQAGDAGNAQWRLRIFTVASVAIALVLLAGAGFIELYANKAAFGASVWGDYFTLLAWGFGAEATRAAVTDLVRTWSLPGMNA